MFILHNGVFVANAFAFAVCERLETTIRGKPTRSREDCKVSFFTLLLFSMHRTHLSLYRIDPETKKVEMSFRSGPIKMTLEDFKEGQKIDGLVRKKETFGVFIQIKDTNVSGLCHKSEVSLLFLIYVKLFLFSSVRRSSLRYPITRKPTFRKYCLDSRREILLEQSSSRSTAKKRRFLSG